MSIKLKEHRKYWKNGKLKELEFHNSQGLNEGKYQFWNKEGRLIEQRFYRNDIIDGECLEWHYNGNLSERKFYQNGELEGKYESWSEEGQIILQGFYRNGKLGGKLCLSYNNGRPQEISLYISGIMTERKLWYPTGQLLARVFKNQTYGTLEGEYRHWNNDGSIREEIFYRKGIAIDQNFTCRKQKVFSNLKSRLKFRLYQNKYKGLKTFIISDLVPEILKQI